MDEWGTQSWEILESGVVAATLMGTESYFYKMDRVHVDGGGGGGGWL